MTYELHLEYSEKIRAVAEELAEMVLQCLSLHEQGKLTEWELQDLQRISITAGYDYLKHGFDGDEDASDLEGEPVDVAMDLVREGDPEELIDVMLAAITTNRPTSSPQRE